MNINSSLLINNTENTSFVFLGGGYIKKSLFVGDDETIGKNNLIQVLPMDVIFTSINQTIKTSSINYKNGYIIF